MNEFKHDDWAGTTYGNGWMHKWLIRFLKAIDVRLLYVFAFVFIVPPTMVVNGKARKAICSFYRKRFGYGQLKSCWMTYKNHCAYSQAVIDKFAMYAGKKFRITVDGYDQFQSLSEQSSGFVQLSSHIGNYEIAGYSLVFKTKRLNALVFGGEKESVMTNRNKMFKDNNIRMIPMTTDMSHLFVINESLSNGEIISMPADRVFGSQKYLLIDFLGAKARFPQGPFLLAAMRDVPMLFMSVMKTAATEYHISVHKIECEVQGSTRNKAADLADKYVGILEETVRKYPAQWYNYFDFWAN